MTPALNQYNCEIYHCLGDPTLPINKKSPKKDDLTKYFNNARWNADGRYLVIVQKENNNNVQILKGFVWANVNPSDKLSIIGQGYVPELLENYDDSNQVESAISKISTIGDKLTVKYTSPDGVGVITAYDEMGNILGMTHGMDGESTLSNCQKAAVVTLTVNSKIADSKSIKVIP